LSIKAPAKNGEDESAARRFVCGAAMMGKASGEALTGRFVE